jgi:hypothetical protein
VGAELGAGSCTMKEKELDQAICKIKIHFN